MPLSPLRFKDFLAGEMNLSDSYPESLSPLASQKGIVTRDHFDVSRCDAMVANFLGAEKVSIGTCVEYGFAHAYRKPIITVMEDGNVHDHAFIREISGFIVPSLEAAAKVLQAIFEYPDRATEPSGF